MFMVKDVVKKEQFLRLDWICWITEVDVPMCCQPTPSSNPLPVTITNSHQKQIKKKKKKNYGKHPSRETCLPSGKQNSPQLSINKDCHPEINRFQRKINII